MSEPAGKSEIEKLFALAEKYQASDIHLKVGSPPVFRVDGRIRELETDPLSPLDVEKMLDTLLTPEQLEIFSKNHDLDFARSVEDIGRFRINAFIQRGSISLAARRVSMRIPDFEELNLEVEQMTRIARLSNGLVIVAGTTGCGKSTTLASIIEHVNLNRRCHIVTIEDPIEYLYTDKKAFVNQREVGIDVPSFKQALRHVMRQDPDVILIGEMRDSETFEAALTAAETGHLVFGTIHASTVAQVISRILDMFPADRHRQILTGLRFNLRSIVCQRLLESSSDKFRLVPAQEILFVNATAARLLGDCEYEKLDQLIRGGTHEGMQDFDRALSKLVEAGLASKETALAASDNPEHLELELKGIKLGGDRRIIS